MGSAKTTIELNGKRYDTATGRIIDDATPAVPLHHIPKKKPSGGIHIDGFVRAASKSAPAKVLHLSAPAPQPATTAIPVKKSAKRTVQHINHHKTQKAHTLMRSAVKKPQVTPIKAVTIPAESTTIQQLEDQLRTIPKHSTMQRFSRAERVHQSSLISKFGTQKEVISKKLQPISVKPTPAHYTSPHSAHEAAPKHAVHTPLKTQHAHHAAPVQTKSEALFSKALETATSHQHKPAKKQRVHHRAARRLGTSTRVVTAGSAMISILLLAGFFAYQNMPNFAMRIAATRAGFHASMPSYKPAGFAMEGPINYSAGQVTVNFKSTTDNRAFKIIQRPSNWNSETLLDQHVASGRKSYQTYQNNGKTIFIYDGTNATWVDGGVWYQIEGSASLNNDQLLKVASSL